MAPSRLAVTVVMLAVLLVGEVADGLGEAKISSGMVAIAAVVTAVALAVWIFQRVSLAEEAQIHEML